MTLQAMIVDDESPARRRVRDLLAREPDIAIAAECTSGREAIDAIGLHRPDLLFLDIQMPGVNGFEVLRGLPSKGLPAVIFTTAYDQHALEAFEVHALDYLLKPFKAARFKAALQRAREHLQERNGGDTDARILALLERFQPKRTYTTRFVVKSATRVVIVKADEIDWIESASNYALLHVGDKTHVLRETMLTNLAVAPDGAVDWLCVPRFDSPSTFGRILGRHAGVWRISPVDVTVPADVRYLPGTMILETGGRLA